MKRNKSNHNNITSKKFKEKRGQSKIITVVLLILIVLILILILWNLLIRLVKQEQRTIDLQQKLMSVKLGIENLDYDEAENKLNLSIERGPEKLIYKGTRTVIKNLTASIVSVADLSGSMGTIVSDCSIDTYTHPGSCCDGNDCSDQTVCETTCGGTYLGTPGDKRCYNPVTYMFLECNQGLFYCETYCGGVWDSGTSTCSITTYATPGSCCDDAITPGIDCSQQTDCENVCSGIFYTDFSGYKSCPNRVWYRETCEGIDFDCIECGGTFTTLGTKLELAKNANLDFIDTVFTENPEHKIGLVAYATTVVDKFPILNATNKTDLEANVTNWAGWGATCICCGINEATSMLIGTGNFKAMVVMTDGQANTVDASCIGINARTASVNAARDAKDSGILVYTIGFGKTSDIDESNLQNIATVGGGKYYYSDVSELQDTYNKTLEEIFKVYATEQKWDHIKIKFINATGSCFEYQYEVPLPLETKTYDNVDVCVSALTRVEIYFAMSDNDDVITGPLLDSWDID